jgi:uncharacterized protein
MKKFACDRTLGRLAKWLRIFGYDTLYWNKIDDEKLIEICQAENRILLTRNTNLIKNIAKRNLKGEFIFYFIPENSVWNQLKNVVKAFELSRENNLNLCSECNAQVIKVDKSEVEGHVPEYVFETQDVFTRCPNCGKYYWQGTHVTRMTNRLDEIFINTQE